MRVLVLVLCMVLLAGCGKNNDPILLGFVGGTSGRVADLGVAGRNGVILAIEQQNAAGGIHGRLVELLVQDDGQDTEQARAAVSQLLEAGVIAIVGPMTSGVAVDVVDLANAARVPLIAPTVTTKALAGLDDYFLRVVAPTSHNAGVMADFIYFDENARRIATVYDMTNRAYAESWLDDFSNAFVEHGGERPVREAFVSGPDADFGAIMERLLATEPDAVGLVSNSVDAAVLLKELRVRAPELTVFTSEWAGTERLVELAGRYAEGVYAPQYLDRDSTQPAYLAFRDAYVARFGQEPGFAGMLAYDATRMTLTAIADSRNPRDVRDTILRTARYPGVQYPIYINQFGDGANTTFITQIRGGQFRVVR